MRMSDWSSDVCSSDLSSSGVGGVSHAYYLDVGISSYELDLFGRVRSLKDEALQTYLATDETRRATHISLISQVAGSYLSPAADLDRSEERRVGNECGSTCRDRGAPDH